VKALILLGDAPAPPPGTDVVLVAWNEAGERRAQAAGATARTVADLIGPQGADAVDEAAIAWTKEWGRRPLVDGRSFRDLASWKGVSLWWFAEIFLHHSTASPARVRVIETVHRLLDAVAPGAVEARGLGAEDALLVERTCTARSVLFEGRRARPRPASVSAILGKSHWNSVKMLATAVKARLAGRPHPPSAGPSTALFLSHAAFWRERTAADGTAAEYEHYFDRLLPAVQNDATLRPFVLAVGPRAAFRRRGLGDRFREWIRLHPDAGPYVHVNRYVDATVVRETRRAEASLRRLWGDLAGRPAAREAFGHRGVPFGDLADADLAATVLLQLPWAVRSYEEMAAALRAVRPSVACLYAESSGWGRAALAACRAAGVPTIAVQHGILYPKYYSYRHDPDEASCPRPDRTAVFGEDARRLLVSRGGYRPESLVVTGSPKFDALLEAATGWDRAALRARLGVGPGESLVAVASRFRGIRETHQAIGTAFPSLVTALESLGVRTLVKPHPAERADGYEAVLREVRAQRTSVLPSSVDLLPLLHAADVLVTVESLSAVEALVLGRPVVILNMPTNLRALVESGAALGVAAGADPTEALRRALFDPATRASLAAARTAYLSDVAHGVDGEATLRILTLLKQAAEGSAPRTAAAAGVIG
jgi:hypothetical protein